MWVGNHIGRVVRVDQTTNSQMRGRFTRLCVQVDLERPLIPMVQIMGYNQIIESESLQ